MAKAVGSGMTALGSNVVSGSMAMGSEVIHGTVVVGANVVEGTKAAGRYHCNWYYYSQYVPIRYKQMTKYEYAMKSSNLLYVL